MGWTGSFVSHKPSKEEELDEIKHLYIGDNLEIIYATKVGSVWYTAVRRKQNDEVFAVVVLTQYRAGEYLTKAMTENECPNECNAPLKLLNMLSPTDNEWALEWRNRCRFNKPSKMPTGEVPLSDAQYLEIQFENDTARLRKSDGMWYAVKTKKSKSGYLYTSEDNLKTKLSDRYPNTPSKVTKYNERTNMKEVIDLNDFSELRGRKTATPRRRAASKKRTPAVKVNVRKMF